MLLGNRTLGCTNDIIEGVINGTEFGFILVKIYGSLSASRWGSRCIPCCWRSPEACGAGPNETDQWDRARRGETGLAANERIPRVTP